MYNLNIRGWMLESELKVIEKWSEHMIDGSIVVEVGSFYGRSAYTFAASNKRIKLYCFDKWVGETEIDNSPGITQEQRESLGYPLLGMINTLENFKKNVAGLYNIISKQVQIPEHVDWKYGRVIDHFFIDAAHKNPWDWDYIQYFIPFIKTGGYISGHDYYPEGGKYPVQFPDVNENVRRLERMFNSEVELYDGSSLWRIKV